MRYVISEDIVIIFMYRNTFQGCKQHWSTQRASVFTKELWWFSVHFSKYYSANC